MVRDRYHRKRLLNSFSASLILLPVLVILAISFFRAKTEQDAQSFQASLPVYKEKVRDKGDAFLLAVASDLHVDPDNHKEGVINALTNYNTEIVEALLTDVGKQDADVLLLCGDLTNAGSDFQHETLTRLMREIEQEDLTILVIPGNHDLNSDHTGDFASMYQDFGYGRAFSRDPGSLGYSVILEDHFFLLLDTGGSMYGWKEVGLSAASLTWIREQLDYASKHHLQILVCGHYPILTYHTTEVVGREELIRLLQEYEVPLYLCGHMHQKNVSYQNSLTELVIEQATAAPCSYALLYNDAPDTYEYIPHRIDVDTWARERGLTDPNLLSFSTYQEQLTKDRCAATVAMLAEGKHISSRQLGYAQEFYYLLQDCYWKGTLSQVRTRLNEHPGYKPFLRIIEHTNYDPWIQSMIEQAEPYVGGFLLRERQLHRDFSR